MDFEGNVVHRHDLFGLAADAAHVGGKYAAKMTDFDGVHFVCS
jgi:hypothetical protein